MDKDLSEMFDVILIVVVGIIVGSVTTYRGYEFVKSRGNWTPASSDEIRRKLENEGSLQDFLDGKIVCPICKTVITFANLWSIMEDDESQDFICRNPECYGSYIGKLHEEMLEYEAA